MVGPSGNDPLPQDFQSSVRQPTIRQTLRKMVGEGGLEPPKCKCIGLVP